MRKDLEVCDAAFKDLIALIGEDIQHGRITKGSIKMMEFFMNTILLPIKGAMIEALIDQEEGGENHENPTNASAH